MPTPTGEVVAQHRGTPNPRASGHLLDPSCSVSSSSRCGQRAPAARSASGAASCRSRPGTAGRRCVPTCAARAGQVLDADGPRRGCASSHSRVAARVSAGDAAPAGSTYCAGRRRGAAARPSGGRCRLAARRRAPAGPGSRHRLDARPRCRRWSAPAVLDVEHVAVHPVPRGSAGPARRRRSSASCSRGRRAGPPAPARRRRCRCSDPGAARRPPPAAASTSAGGTARTSRSASPARATRSAVSSRSRPCSSDDVEPDDGADRPGLAARRARSRTTGSPGSSGRSMPKTSQRTPSSNAKTSSRTGTATDRITAPVWQEVAAGCQSCHWWHDVDAAQTFCHDDIPGADLHPGPRRARRRAPDLPPRPPGRPAAQPPRLDRRPAAVPAVRRAVLTGGPGHTRRLGGRRSAPSLRT